MSTVPLQMTASGPTPTSPSALRATLVQNVGAVDPDYTANLPGSLIEDIASTDVAALALMDQARVDAINSVTPYTANPFVLAAQGAMLGIAQGQPANASVYVIFTGPAGYVFPPGFLVSDGTQQYALQDGGVIGASGTSPQLFAVCTETGTFSIPPNTVTQLITSVASGNTITVTNPEAGTPATAAESVQSYRSRVLLALQASATGMPSYLKTLLYKIPGVQPDRVAIKQTTGGWRVICGGGDAYQVANAILNAMPDITALAGSALAITGISQTNPVVVTTNYNTDFVAGQTFTLTGAAPIAYATTYTVASVDGQNITTTTNGSSFGAYQGGAVFSPNPRNVAVSIFQNPDTYNIVFVNPPEQIVTVAAIWNTTLPDFTATNSVQQLAATAIQGYINGLLVGQPINVLEMNTVFQNAVASAIDASNLTTLEFTVTIDGTEVAPSAGASVIEGDPEGYFNCAASGVTITQG